MREERFQGILLLRIHKELVVKIIHSGRDHKIEVLTQSRRTK